jgi:hypothetical protein
MSNHGGLWGLYQWFREHGSQLIYPEDLNSFERLQPNSKVFLCEQDEGEYLVLRYDRERFRVKRALFKPVGSPKVGFGEKVWVRKEKRVIEGKVSDIIWHFQREEPMYFLELEGKKAKKQYWAADFLPEARGQKTSIAPTS